MAAYSRAVGATAEQASHLCSSTLAGGPKRRPVLLIVTGEQVDRTRVKAVFQVIS